MRLELIGYHFHLLLVQTSLSRVEQLDRLVSNAEHYVLELTTIVVNGSSGNVSMSPMQLKVEAQNIFSLLLMSMNNASHLNSTFSNIQVVT